jgi:hypothetical protein
MKHDLLMNQDSQPILEVTGNLKPIGTEERPSLAVTKSSPAPDTHSGVSLTPMAASAPDPSGDDLLVITSVIRDRLGRIATNLIEIGENLLKAKALTGHGGFGRYLKAEFDMSERTAERYMAAAERFAGKSDTVSDLPPTLVYKLAAKSTPDDLVREVIQRREAGEPMPLAEIQKRLAAHTPKRGRKASPGREPAAKVTPGEMAAAEAGVQQEQPASDEAAQAAASMIVEALGDRLHDLLELLCACDPRDVLVLLTARQAS